MFSSNQLKIVFLAGALFASACGFWHKPDAAASPPFVAAELKSTIPFSSKEPDSYQTEIVVTANNAEDRTFAARDKEKRLIIFNFQAESEISVLQLGAGQSFLIAANRKIYAENEKGGRSENTSDFFAAEWLSQKTDAQFEALAAENNLVRYRVSLDETKNSEIIVFVDTQIALPVRQEFYSVKDGEKRLNLTMELRNFSAQPDAKLFEVPKDFRKVSLKEFRQAAHRGQVK